MEKITQTEWAREIGVSKQYVCYLVKKGIVELEDGLIDREQANRAIETIRDPSQPLRRKNYSESGEKLSTMLLKTIVLPKVNDKGIISYLSYNGV